MKSRDGGGLGGERTMMIKAPAFSAAGRAWRPYRFAGLEKVTKHHAQLLSRLEWMLPNVRATGEVSESVKKRLQEMLEQEVTIAAEYAHIVPPSKLRRYVGEPTFLAILAPQPNKTRGLLEVELGLAHQVIDLLLGGTGEAVGLRPLTDIEEGVMTYVIIETLKALSPSLDPSLPKLRVEGVARGFEDAMALMGEEENLAVVQLKMVFGAHSGYLRIFIPEGVLAGANPPADAAVRRARRRADAEANAHRLANVKVWLRAEIAQVEISSGDLAQLRERDVILVDGLTCRPDKAEGGTAQLKLGLGRTGSLNADVAVEAGRFKATITALKAGEDPPPGGPTEEGAEAAEGAAAEGEAQPKAEAAGGEESTNPGQVLERRANVQEGSPEGADMLNDIPLQISVELGRLPITAEEVVGLKVGHVFDLNRAAGEPLDLSVNGKIVARGELVEIDGNLGVRVLSLAG